MAVNFRRVTNRDPWQETYGLKDLTTGADIILLNPVGGAPLYSIVVEIWRPTRGPGHASSASLVLPSSTAPILSASTANGKVIVPANGQFQWLFYDSDMQQLSAPATYEVRARVASLTNPSSDAATLFLGTLPVIQG